jgi:hypothetical protein
LDRRRGVPLGLAVERRDQAGPHLLVPGSLRDLGRI